MLAVSVLRSQLSFSKTDIMLAIWVFYLLLHGIFVVQVNFHPFGILQTLALLAVYIIVRSLKTKYVKWIIIALFIALITQIIWGVLQKFSVLDSFHNKFEITGSFFNPAPFSGFLVAVLCPVIGLLVYDKVAGIFHRETNSAKWINVVLILTVVLGIIVLVLAKSRAAWVSLLSAIVFIGINSFTTNNNIIVKLKQIKIGFHINAQFLIIGGIIVMGATILAGGILLYKIRPGSVDGRMLVWNNTIKMIVDKPFTGNGIGQFNAVYMDYQAEYFKEPRSINEQTIADNTIYAFNDYLKLASETGIPGLLLALCIIGSIFFVRTRAGGNKYFGISVKAGILGLLVFGMFSYPASVFTLQVIFIIYLALIARQQKRFKIAAFLETSRVLLFARIFFLVGFLGVLVLFYIPWVYRLTTSCKSLKEALQGFNSAKEKIALQTCKEIYPVLKNDSFFLTTYGKLLKQNAQAEEAISMLKKATQTQPTSDLYLALGECYQEQNRLVDAELAYRYALQMVPSRTKPVWLLTWLYYQIGRDQDALCLLESYFETGNLKRTVASYALELELMELRKDIENHLKPKKEEKP